MKTRGPKIKDVAGKQYGYLLGIKRIDTTYALYKCLLCGTEVKKRYAAVAAGNTKSCDCLLPTEVITARKK